MGEDALTRINHAGWKGKGDDSREKAQSTLDVIFMKNVFLAFLQPAPLREHSSEQTV